MTHYCQGSEMYTRRGRVTINNVYSNSILTYFKCGLSIATLFQGMFTRATMNRGILTYFKGCIVARGDRQQSSINCYSVFLPLKQVTESCCPLFVGLFVLCLRLCKGEWIDKSSHLTAGLGAQLLCGRVLRGLLATERSQESYKEEDAKWREI